MHGLMNVKFEHLALFLDKWTAWFSLAVRHFVSKYSAQILWWEGEGGLFLRLFRSVEACFDRLSQTTWPLLINTEVTDATTATSNVILIHAMNACRSSRHIWWAGHVVRKGKRRGIYRGLVGKPEGKRPLGRHRCRWEDNIKMDLQEAECGGMDWMELAQDKGRWRALVNVVMNFRVP